SYTHICLLHSFPTRRSSDLEVPAEGNLAKQLALRLHGKLPLIYGTGGWRGAVAYRWKCQINENAKAPAWCNTFPELNHNETVGRSEEHTSELQSRENLVCRL